MNMKLLKGGSASSVYLDEIHNEILKTVRVTDTNGFNHLRDQHCWMAYHKEALPNYFPHIGDDFFKDGLYCYRMEFVEGKTLDKMLDNKFIARNLLEDVMHTVVSISDIDFIPKGNTTFTTYIDRLKGHLRRLKKETIFVDMLMKKEFILVENGVEKVIPNIDFIKFISMLTSMTSYMDKQYSNCHGDLTLENIIINEYEDFGCNRIKFIDDNFIFNGWNSYLLDYSKIFQSLHFNYEETFSDSSSLIIDDGKYLLTYNTENVKIKEYLFGHGCGFFTDAVRDASLVLEVTHYIRMLIYKLAISQKDFIVAYIRTCQAYHELKKRGS